MRLQLTAIMPRARQSAKKDTINHHNRAWAHYFNCINCMSMAETTSSLNCKQHCNKQSRISACYSLLNTYRTFLFKAPRKIISTPRGCSILIKELGQRGIYLEGCLLIGDQNQCLNIKIEYGCSKLVFQFLNMFEELDDFALHLQRHPLTIPY